MRFTAQSDRLAAPPPRWHPEDGLDLSSRRAHVLLIGGPDVSARGELMDALVERFEISAAGSEPQDGERLARLGFRFYHYPMSRGGSPAADLQTCAALFRICRRVRPDIVHAFATKPCVWGRLGARLAGVPIVIGTLPGLGSLYSGDDFKRRTLKRIYEALQRSASRVSDATIFQNRQDADQMMEAGVVPSNRTVIIRGSGIRTDIFDRTKVSREAVRRLRAEFGLFNGTVLVTMVSRVIRSKGVLVFAEAARQVRERTCNVRFLLVGPNDRNSVDSLSKEELARLAASVSWVGRRRDIREILAVTDAFALPTHYREGIPRVLLEAASMSLPLIATARPGCEEVVREGRNGFLVNARDPAGLAEAILKLVHRPDLRRTYAAESRRIAVEEFDLREIASRTAVLYQEFLRGHPWLERKSSHKDLGRVDGTANEVGCLAGNTSTSSRVTRRPPAKSGAPSIPEVESVPET